MPGLKERAQGLALRSSGVKVIRTLGVWRTLVVPGNHSYMMKLPEQKLGMR